MSVNRWGFFSPTKSTCYSWLSVGALTAFYLWTKGGSKTNDLGPVSQDRRTWDEGGKKGGRRLRKGKMIEEIKEKKSEGEIWSQKVGRKENLQISFGSGESSSACEQFSRGNDSSNFDRVACLTAAPGNHGWPLGPASKPAFITRVTITTDEVDLHRGGAGTWTLFLPPALGLFCYPGTQTSLHPPRKPITATLRNNLCFPWSRWDCSAEEDLFGLCKRGLKNKTDVCHLCDKICSQTGVRNSMSAEKANSTISFQPSFNSSDLLPLSSFHHKQFIHFHTVDKDIFMSSEKTADPSMKMSTEPRAA